MTADTSPELLEMAERIGVNKKWVQNPGQIREHFDICLAMRAKAVRFGAVETSARAEALRRIAKQNCGAA